MNFRCVAGHCDVDAEQPIVMRITGGLALGDASRLCEQLSGRLRDGRTVPPTAWIDVGGLTHINLAAVDALARLQLTARRHGTRMLLCGTPPELAALLDLVGLPDLADTA